MNSRRQFIHKTISIFAFIATLFNPISSVIQSAYAKVKRILVPKGTPMTDLIKEDPAKLDTRNLEVIPLTEFETMGYTEHSVNVQQWRLDISGKVKKPLQLTYSQLLDLPAIERKVLLICPGFFSNHGLWRGISIMELLNMSGAQAEITHVTLRGADTYSEKADRFAIEIIRANKVFLAYQVNGQVLPKKHGFPLRAVAQDHYGSSWTKYVHTVEAEKIKH
jgi:sulfoxide reductase catalytic subunit YedY